MAERVEQHLGDIERLALVQLEWCERRWHVESRGQRRPDLSEPDAVDALAAVGGDDLGEEPTHDSGRALTVVLIEHAEALRLSTDRLDEVTELGDFGVTSEALPEHAALKRSGVCPLEVGGEEGRILSTVGEHQQLASAG